MQFNGQKILIVGLARSGIEAAKLALDAGAEVSVYDGKTKEQFNSDVIAFTETLSNAFFGEMPKRLDYDLLVKSPGVPPTIPLIVDAKAKEISVIGEIEFASIFARGRFAAITGTNGKTTTTTLTATLLKSAGLNAVACGNIGLPLSSVIRTMDSEDLIYVLEVSSYQLENYNNFTPEVGAILNLTPDHLARHKTMENYQNAKLNAIKNIYLPQNIIFNADDQRLSSLNVRYPDATTFSKAKQAFGFYLNKGAICYSYDGEEHQVVATSELLLKGEHNYENVMAALAICYSLDVNLNAVIKALKNFKGVEHRNEFVCEYQSVKFYNDSKATNPEASIPALKALEHPTILIAGGMDKGSDYSVLMANFTQVKHVILLGETKYDIALVLERYKYFNFQLVDTMEQAVDAAFKQAQDGDNILLSPACASWDMYDSFEVRGEHFKTCIKALTEVCL